MDAGNPAVRWAAWWLGWCLRAAQFVWRFAGQVWRLFGGERLILNLMALCGILGGAMLLWWSVLEPLVPMRSAEVIEPPNAAIVVNRDISQEFRITRRVCMKRPAWGHVSRYYIGMDGDGVEYKLAVRDSLFFPAGCHIRSRVAELPKSLPPGEYVYRTSVEFCGRMRCEEGWAQDVRVTVTGRWPLELTLPTKPFREPL